jgi:hypothetical protein
MANLARRSTTNRIREQIQHEDELVNLRVVWQLLAQSFFFNTYASLLTVKGDAKNLLYGLEQDVAPLAGPNRRPAGRCTHVTQRLYLARQC